MKEALLADKKKSALLGGLTVVLIVVAARAFTGKPVPAVADGADLIVTPPADAPPPSLEPIPPIVERLDARAADDPGLQRAVDSFKAVTGSQMALLPYGMRDEIAARMSAGMGPALDAVQAAAESAARMREIAESLEDEYQGSSEPFGSGGRLPGEPGVPQAAGVGSDDTVDSKAAASRADDADRRVRAQPKEPKRDLFTVNDLSAFPPAYVSRPAPTSRPDDTGGLSVWSKLGERLARVQDERQQELRQLDEDLRALRLQATVSGAHPSAHISGRLVHEGDIISGFTVVRVRERSVELHRTGTTRELTFP